VSTKASYDTARRDLHRFLRRCGLAPQWPVPPQVIGWWASDQADRGTVTAQTIKKYVTAIGTLHELDGFANPTLQGDPVLQRALKGIERARPDRPRRERRAVTVELLRRLEPLHDFTRRCDLMMFAAMATATCGLFRLAELVLKRRGGTASRPVRVRDVTLRGAEREFMPIPTPEQCSPQAPDHVEIHLLSSKTDQLQQGHAVVISCPLAVQALWRYLVARRACPAPEQALFSLPNGDPLTAKQLVRHARGMLSRVGEDPSQYSGHSFRRGGATSLARAGQIEALKAAGRWKSECFKLYIEEEESARAVIAAGKRMA
jgi:hypothetical protein